MSILEVYDHTVPAVLHDPTPISINVLARMLKLGGFHS
jgi:hypothetical protein